MGSDWSRRDVMKSGAALGAGLGLGALMSPAVAARLSRRDGEAIRVGVIGCGGRGTGAAVNALEADPATRIVAMADLFRDRLDGSHGHLAGREDFGGRVDVPEERRFAGFGAYEKLLALDDVDYVVLATPPGFRPTHIEAAVKAGKHVFSEKPVAVDPVGVRKVMAAGEMADEKGLSFVAGTQRRHEPCYRELVSRIADGEIGEVVSASCYWNMGTLWTHERKPEYSDTEWQCRNWLYFCWLSGDHICEQHVHNLDVINWVKGGPPVKAMGMGGRAARTGEIHGNIFDHFAVEYEYADGTPLTSMCRQTAGAAGRVEERVRGTTGRALGRPGFAVIEGGGGSWRFRGENPNPYMLEHRNLIRSIRGDVSRVNEARQIAESTMTAIMGRMSAYTGKEVSWEQAMASELDLMPAELGFGPLAVRDVPTPGVTPLV